MLNRTIAPISHDIQGMSLVKPDHIVLDNGLDIWIFRSKDQPLVKAEFIFKNQFTAGAENPLRNTALSALMKEGTSKLSSAEIAEKIDYYGAFLVPEFSFDHASYTLYTLNKYVSQVVPLVYDLFVDAQFPVQELETFKRANRQNLQISLEKNEFIAKRMFYQSLFGNNRYGAPITEDDIQQLDRQDLKKLYTEQIQPDNCILFLSGNITDEVLAEVTGYFGKQWQCAAKDEAYVDRLRLSNEYDTELQYRARPDAMQSAIRLGKQTLRRTDPDYPALQFVNTLFGGYFGSRLMRNIREEKGYTYGINSSLVSLQHSGMLVISTQVGSAVTAAALAEIKKEMDLLQNDLADDAEIHLVRNYLLGAMLGSLESIFSHADKFKAVLLLGLDLSYYDYYAEVLHTIDAQKIRTLAQAHLQYDDMVKVVVGKM